VPVVLNVRHLTGFKARRPIMPPGAVYIGRSMLRYGLRASKWANPFQLRGNATSEERAEAIAAYERWLRQQRYDPAREALLAPVWIRSFSPL
jgi:hypothetical protein